MARLRLGDLRLVEVRGISWELVETFVDKEMGNVPCRMRSFEGGLLCNGDVVVLWRRKLV